MEILHINTNDLRGGAAKVMDRLIVAQNSIDMKSRSLVGQKEWEVNYSFPFEKLTNQDLTENCIDSGMVDYDQLGAYSLIENPLFQQADVIHLHNIHGGYFNPYVLSSLSHLKPIVWTLHDMQSITGHCSYSYECNKWLTGCGDCPNLTEYPAIKLDRTNLNWLEKLEIYKKSKLYIVPVAKWIGDIARQGILNNQPMQTILNGVNIDIYKPLNKDVLREKYGIPTNKIIIGAVANGGTFGAERKGGKYVQAVMDRLIELGYDVLLVNVGGERKGYKSEYLYDVGYISSEEEMAEIYNAFDIYLFPSTADTCPLVISEAMACEVPVVTFETGGIPELVQHGKTGFVAPHKDLEALYKYTEQLVVDSNLRSKFAQQAREYCINHFEHSLIVEEYNQVYKNAMESFEKRRDEILYFDLKKVPLIIKQTDQFQLAEQLKGQALPRLIKDPQQLYLITNENMNSTYFKTISMREAKATKFEKDDIIYIPKKIFVRSDQFFKTMLYKSIQTDILVSTFLLKNQNNKTFFKAVSTINDNQVDTSMEGIFYRGEFFNTNAQDILNEKLISVTTKEEYYTELIHIPLNKYMLLKVNQPIYIYGAGKHTIDLIKESPELKPYIKGIIDRNPKIHGTYLMNEYKIYKLNEIDEVTPILISSASFENEIYNQLENIIPNSLLKIYNY